MACRQMAPGLVQVHRRFKDRGVAFVSLSNVGESATESFAKQNSVSWPCGYGSTLETIARFGAYSTDRMSASYNPGYEVSPTLYLIGPDGHILWNDAQARPRHLKDTEAILRDLAAQIEKALRDDAHVN